MGIKLLILHKNKSHLRYLTTVGNDRKILASHNGFGIDTNGVHSIPYVYDLIKSSELHIITTVQSPSYPLFQLNHNTTRHIYLIF